MTTYSTSRPASTLLTTFSSTLSRTIFFCFSFTFFGFFALIGPSSCLFFHCSNPHQHAFTFIPHLGAPNSPSRHIYNEDTVPQIPSRLLHPQRLISSIHLGTTCATFEFHRLDNARGCCEECRIVCMAFCGCLMRFLLRDGRP